MKNKISKTFVLFAFISIFLIVNIFAQKTNNSSENKTLVIPKVIKVDDDSIKEILKPKGKPLFVNFWATWCVPCREEFPELVELTHKYKDKIDLITVSLDDLAEINRDVPKFLTDMKATMPAYLLKTDDENAVLNSISKDYAGGLPFSVLYNEKGEVIYTKQGKIKVDVVKSKIERAISSKGTPSLSNVQTTNLPINRVNIYTYEKGVSDAKKDIAKGIYKIKYYGLVPMATVEHTNELKQKYGIEIIYNGCLVSAGMIEYGKGYNKISKVAIKQKFNIEF